MDKSNMAHLLTGIVVSRKMKNTVVVEITTKMRHEMYRKVITRTKRLKVHCEDVAVKDGDLISFMETRPISKEVNFTFVAIVEAK